MNFKIFKSLLKAPFTVYAAFECVLVPWTDYNNYNGGLSTENNQDNIVCSYG